MKFKLVYEFEYEPVLENYGEFDEIEEALQIDINNARKYPMEIFDFNNGTATIIRGEIIDV